MNRLINWRNTCRRDRAGRGHVLRVLATAAILFGAPPAWPQNEGGNRPNPENTFHSSTIASYVARFARPQTAEAAPRTTQRHTQRVRMSRMKKPVVAQASRPAPEVPSSPPPPSEPIWPNAQESVGAAGLVPVVIKTVREMVEPEPEAPTVLENELSDIDLAARPVASHGETPVATTDGRAEVEDDWRGNRFAAFADNVKAIGSASWLEPIFLALAGAFAAVTAMRVFAV
jgi:hypothetical protein